MAVFHELLAAQNKALVLSFYRSLDNRRLRDAIALLSTGLQAHMPGHTQPLTYESFAALGTEVFNAFPDGRHTFTHAFVRHDMVTTVGHFTGTHLDTFQGLPATGKRICFSVMHIDRVHHSKIVEHWGQGDSLGLVQQLGIKLVPGPNVLMKLGVQAGKHLSGETFERLRAVTQPDYYPNVPEG